MSEPSKRSPKRALIIIGTALAVIAILAAWFGRFQYDEAAHRRVIEAYAGPVADWDSYRDDALEACEYSKDAFELYVQLKRDPAQVQLDIQYACPDRMDEFTDITGMEPLD
jgi:hypothetical protein